MVGAGASSPIVQSAPFGSDVRDSSELDTPRVGGEPGSPSSSVSGSEADVDHEVHTGSANDEGREPSVSSTAHGGHEASGGVGSRLGGLLGTIKESQSAHGGTGTAPSKSTDMQGHASEAWGGSPTPSSKSLSGFQSKS